MHTTCAYMAALATLTRDLPHLALHTSIQIQFYTRGL